ncbi:hypothetical protein ABZV67_28780 [Streptomyces sp. NPDC005065]|uniref:hypothetical protein n=1 Tax=unclassified Streptomyces TaxID=2593676 RepID=UPI0033B544DD
MNATRGTTSTTGTPELAEAADEALAATALQAVGGNDKELLFLAGSTTDGLANRNSDLDLYVIGASRISGSETAARKGERTATVAYHEGREVNVAVLDPAALDALRDAFRASVASLSEEKGIAQLVDEDNLKLLHRIRTGRALRRPDLLNALREEHGTGHLARYLLNASAIAAVNRLTDVTGELADGHHDSAVWMYREALMHAGQCALAAAGVTVPSTKWLMRLLQREAERQDGTGCAAHVARHLLTPPSDPVAAMRETRAELALVIDAAGDLAGPYVRTVARRKLG